MNVEGEIPAGYKRTEVGVIPRDWRVAPLRELIQRTEYGSSAPSKRAGHVPVLRMGNIQAGKIDWTDLAYTDDPREADRFEVHCGDVLFNRTNTVDLVGKTAIFDDTRKAAFAGYLIRITTRPERLDPRYLNYVMNTPVARAHGLKVLSVAVGQANINAEKLRSYPIPLPRHVGEQRTIADALGDVDALLDALDRLIAKQRDVKQAAMQQLLTGRTRLPGFTGEWQTKRLGEICQLSMGRTPPRTDAKSWGGSNVWLSIADMTGKVVAASKEHISDKAAPTVPIVRSGTLLMSFKLTIGRLCFAGCDLYTNEAICAFNDLQASPDYLFYALTRVDFSLYGKQAVKGYTLNKDSLALVEVPTPTRAEQTAIAAVLSDMDAEIAALEARRAKTRDIKQAMMQELLTGRTRLV